MRKSDFPLSASTAHALAVVRRWRGAPAGIGESGKNDENRRKRSG
jgi:hypothetical protein